MTLLVEAQGLARHYTVRRGLWRSPGTVRALDGVSLAIAAGTTLAVVGESGSGKSTLARAVTMIEVPTAGTLRIDGIDVGQADRAALARLRTRVQMVFQNPYASLNPRKSIAALLGEPLAIQRATLSARARRTAAREALARVGLGSAALDRYPHMFSGGQRQRIAIARALMLAPALVVADEPVAALDVSIQAQVLNLLMDLKDASGVAYLFITHNLEVVRHIADEVAVMYFGRIVERAAKRTLFEAPRHPYTQVLLAATPTLAPRRTPTPPRGEPPSPLAPPAGCAFHGRCPLAVDRCRVEVPALRQVGKTWVACHLAG
jgi:dipeptide transport system ATP-binding protein